MNEERILRLTKEQYQKFGDYLGGDVIFPYWDDLESAPPKDWFEQMDDLKHALKLWESGQNVYRGKSQSRHEGDKDV